MALPAEIATLEEVEEPFREHYTSQGGVFVLGVDGIKEHPVVKGLSRAYDAEKARAKERAEKLKAFGDLTPDEITELRSELETLREGKGGDLISAEELKELKERQRELAKRAKEADDLKVELEFRDRDQQTRLKQEIRGALAAAGVRKEAIPAAAALIQTEFSARYERGDDGFQPMVTGDLNGIPGDHSLSEFVSSYIEGDGSVFMPPSGKGGSGADPNNRSGNKTQGGVKQVRMEGSTVRVNPQDVLDGRTAVVRD